ncbi:uncharacterized protein MEPE_06316 [Melanopsichium pennsylvanicum]|uniref:Galactose oxidase n=2 Tax=Melanopsichium pennsylvanicum TaxID=63383 RepID=A0AAJ4XTD9_9BASI|nr:conserved hypothetical protein [Melanopsichium pennsylvanicum 4]SNX87606.1 uncharacterized protein MEPE_06316 [Melanopsichium pennsylvanicum]
MVTLLLSRATSRPSRSSMRNTTWLFLALPFIGAATAQTAVESLPARWGQASALIDSLFLVQGGKTQGSSGGGYTYSSAPSDAHMYTLDLSSAFSLSSPPWQSVLATSDAPAALAVSFHTISPLNSTSLLLFGGDGSPEVPVQTGNDSAYIVTLGGSTSNRTVTYSPVPSTWSQPTRRIYHTTESNAQGSVYIIGGEKADGSGLIFDQQFNLDTTSSSPTFQLASITPPGSLEGSTSTLLSDGTLLVLGGVDATGQLQSMQNLYAYSTKSSTWAQTSTQAAQNMSTRAPAFPAARRGHVAVSLPNQRVFIHGGASADLSTVYSDAWILDWSVNPPVWTLVNDTGGPGPRFAHSAVAYGRQVLISFGWAGANAAPTGLHIFDASNMTASTSTKGSWSGGSWSTTTYTPDPQVTRSSSSSTSSSSSSTGNGSSTSSGGSSTSTSDDSSSSDSSSSNSSSGNSSSDDSNSGSTDASPSFPTSTSVPNSGDDGNANTDSSGGSSNGAKAGAAVGALLGAGLVVGAGYAAYRHRSLDNYRRYGDGSVGLLGFGSRRNPDDEDYLMEKGFTPDEYDRPYHRSGGGAPLTGGVTFGRKRGRNEAGVWTAGNLGHAMEGSGPHFRERIAILAGRGKRDTQVAPRFDMLADEGESEFRPHNTQSHSHMYDDEDDQADHTRWQDRQLRQHSYAHVDHDDLSSGDIGRLRHENEQIDMRSPFDNRPEELAPTGYAIFGASQGYGKLADRETDAFSDRHSISARSDLETQEGPSSGPSVQSHSTTSKSDAAVSFSKSYDMLSAGGIVSFSDASHGRRSGLANNGMKRSSTWWVRFMGNSIERSASGRFLSGPNAGMPIRDPAPPPQVSELQPITESPRSRNVSEILPQDLFVDSSPTHKNVGMDEMGRRVATHHADGEEYRNHVQQQSLSSNGSARTGASSHFESRLRGMDVIQRVRTGSSRRAQSTRTGSTMSDTDSEPALSRGPTLLRPRNVVNSETSEGIGLEQETPGSVVWRPEDWVHSIGRGGLEGVVEESVDDLNTNVVNVADNDSPAVFSKREKGYRQSNVSETPSITPLTTKRARLNPVMVSPLFPSPSHVSTPSALVVAALGSSVKDKVRAFESQTGSNTTESVCISAWTASMSNAKSATILTTSNDPMPRVGEVRMERMTSTSAASSMTTSSEARRVGRKGHKGQFLTHGLVPKAQLFVANPDHTKYYTSSSDGSIFNP